jgi:hypothetical protein
MQNLTKPNSAFVLAFSVNSPVTGAAVNADSLPSAVAYKDGVDYSGTLTLTVANLTTGRYKITGTTPADCPVPSTLHVFISATVAGIAVEAPPIMLRVVPANVYDSLVAGSDTLDVTSPFTNLAKIVVSENPSDPIGTDDAPPLGNYTYNGAYLSLPQCDASGPEGTWTWSSSDYGTRWRIGVGVDATTFYLSPVNEPFGVYTLTGAGLGGYVGSVVVSPNADAPFKAAMIGFLPMAGDALAVPLPNRSEAADAVCDEALSGHTTAGTVGKKLTDTYDAVLAVGIVGTQVAYSPTSATRTIGTDQGGTFASLAAHDDVNFATGEVVGTGLSVLVEVSSSTVGQIPAMLHVTGYYSGSSSHYMSVQTYNYSTSSWAEVGRMLDRSAAFDYTFPLTADNHDGSGAMQVRFVHSTGTYNNSHRLYLDWIAFDKQVTDSETASAIAAIKAQTDRIQFTGLNLVMADADASGLRSAVGMASANLDTQLSTLSTKIGTPVALDSGTATLAGMLTKMADDSTGTAFDATTDSLEAIRNRGDAAWLGGAIAAVALQADVEDYDFTIYQYGDWKSSTGSALSFTVTDEDGVAVSLTGKSLTMVIYSLTAAGEPSTTLCQFATGGTGLTIGGTSGNVVSLSYGDDSSHPTTEAGVYRYDVWNTTDDVRVWGGTCTIKTTKDVTA